MNAMPILPAIFLKRLNILVAFPISSFGIVAKAMLAKE